MNSGRVGIDDQSIDDDPGDTADADADADGGAGAGDDDDLDDAIVLPWWQRPFNIAVIVVTAALLAAMVGWMIGDSANGRDADPVDVGFLQDMRTHHEQAVAMSFMYLALEDTQPGLRDVARDIAFGQGIDIGRMIQLLRDFGESEVNEGDTAMAWMGHSIPIDEMPGLATDEQLDEFGSTSGADADRMFVDLMVSHHRGGIEMAEFAAANASDDEVRSMAASIADSQGDEIIEIERLVD